MEQENLLRMCSIGKIFPGSIALDNVSLDLKKGEIHGIVGENGAGKSTLMKVLSGIYQPNSGKIFFKGKEIKLHSSKDAIEKGISIVHQELVNCPHLTVAENIFMGQMDSMGGGVHISFRELNKKADELLQLFGIKISARAKVKNLSISHQQIVEIAKAISFNCSVIIFDEPTTSLTEDETQSLFKIIHGLKEQGLGILYISHRMDEIFNNCDRVTVLRDGHYIDTLEVASTDRETIVSKMIGRSIDNYYPDKGTEAGERIFEVKNFKRNKGDEPIDFYLQRGEILGFSGLVGAGRTELFQAICGLQPKVSAELTLEGGALELNSYTQAVENGIVYLSEDRKSEGLFLEMPVKKNISVLRLENILGGRLFLSEKKENEQAQKYMESLNIKCKSINQIIGTLSGGNQQKVLLGKMLSVSPKLVILDEPTRGIDIGAKLEIYQMLREMASKGMGVIIISSDLPEIVGVCDRVAVMYEGKLRGIVENELINEKNIMRIASGIDGNSH